MGLLTSRLMHCASNVGVMLAIIAGVSGQGIDAKQVPEINFRIARATEPRLNILGGTGSGGGIGGAGKHENPDLTVELVESKESSCDRPRRYAEVRLTNATTHPMDLPWDPDGARVVVDRGEGSEITFETLFVVLRSKTAPDVFISRTLFGNQSAARSRITVPARGFVVLRNILLPESAGVLCGSNISAQIQLTQHRLLRADKGYLMTSEPYQSCGGAQPVPYCQ